MENINRLVVRYIPPPWVIYMNLHINNMWPIGSIFIINEILIKLIISKKYTFFKSPWIYIFNKTFTIFEMTSEKTLKNKQIMALKLLNNFRPTIVPTKPSIIECEIHKKSMKYPEFWGWNTWYSEKKKNSRIICRWSCGPSVSWFFSQNSFFKDEIERKKNSKKKNNVFLKHSFWKKSTIYTRKSVKKIQFFSVNIYYEDICDYFVMRPLAFFF